MQANSEAYEAEDRCLRVAVARRLMLPHPAASNAADVAQSCPNKSAAGQICSKPVDLQRHNCYGCRYGGGTADMPQWPRCSAYVIHSHSGTKVFTEQDGPALTRVVNGQREHARMDLVFNLNGSVTYLDVSIVGPFSLQQPAPAQDTWPRELRRANSTDIHFQPCPFHPRDHCPGHHARKFISNLMKDAANPPLAIGDTWSAIQSVLHSAISKQQLTAAVT